jgi:type I restriction enzyme, S subunit
MKEGWEEKKIGDVCTILNGGTPKTNVPEYWDGDVLWITPKDMGQLTSEYVSDTSRKISKLGLQKSSAKLIPINSIILSTRAPIGHLAINTKEITTNQGCRGLVPDEVLDTRYFYYFCCNSVERFNDLGSGTTFKELSKKALSSVIIPIPPLPEQKEIVKILDEAFAAIDEAKANIEKNIENAKELFQSRLNDYDFPIEKLENLVDIKTGKLNANAAVEGGKYPFFTCSRDIFQIDKYAYDCEAILLAGNNAVGDFNVKHFKGKFEAYQRTYIITVKDESNLNYRFLYFQMLNSLQELKKQSVGTGTKFLKLPVIKSFKIACPTIDEQNQFVEEMDFLLNETDDLVLSYQQKLTNLEELKKSLLQKAFAGELT